MVLNHILLLKVGLFIVGYGLNHFEPKACVLGDVFFEKDAGKDAPADQDFGSRIAVVCLGRTKLTSC